MERKEDIKREMFLEDLPRYNNGISKGRFNWVKPIGRKVKFVYNNFEGEVEIIDYVEEYLYLKYKNKDAFKIKANNFIRCKLGKLLEKKTNEFKIEIGQVFKDDKRDIVITDREYRNRIDENGNKKYYKYRCSKCGYDEGWIVETDLLNETGCACCRGFTVVEGINDINTTNPEIVKFFANYEESKKYSKSSHKKIKVICPDCGREKDKEIMVNTLYTTKSIGCKYCGDGYSYGHKYMFNLLTQLNQDFKDNHKFDWCKFYNPYKKKDVTGEYDFVIESINLIIEVDGGFHRRNNTINGQTKEESQFLDDEKDKLARHNGYNIVRIMYDDEGIKIKGYILNSKLSCLFDLSTIDWLKCEKFALKSRVKEACDLKRNNQEYSTTDIAKIMNTSSPTIIKYLKKGSKLGWCNYNKEEEIIRGRSKSGKSNGKPVEIFKDEVSLGIFPSCSEIGRQSEELFGIKLIGSEISIVCLGKRKQYKGFTFKYV